MFLNHDSTITKFPCSHFFHKGYLTSSEKQFCLAKLVLVFILDEFSDNIFTCCPKITSFDVFGMAKDSVTKKEIVISPSGRKT